VISGPLNGFSGTALACRRSERVIFEGLDFAVQPGGALLLTGPNGSGKSSLLRLMAGLIKPFAGSLEWDGAPVKGDPTSHRERVAYLGHKDALKLVLTTAENVRLWTALRGRSGRADSALRALDLSHLADVPARFLSSGQSRRAALARIVASGAPLWLLDEPTVGLDNASIAALEAVLAAHRAGGGIVVAATHAPFLAPGASVLDLAAFVADPWTEEDAA
jgi:heme exporter protein A